MTHGTNPRERIGPMPQHLLLSAAVRVSGRDQMTHMTEDEARDTLSPRWAVRPPGKLFSLSCGRLTSARLAEPRRRWKCGACRRKFSLTSLIPPSFAKAAVPDTPRDCAFVNGVKNRPHCRSAATSMSIQCALSRSRDRTAVQPCSSPLQPYPLFIGPAHTRDMNWSRPSQQPTATICDCRRLMTRTVSTSSCALKRRASHAARFKRGWGTSPIATTLRYSLSAVESQASSRRPTLAEDSDSQWNNLNTHPNGD
jgi:hypothetical protein